jgi:hypothetical protein
MRLFHFSENPDIAEFVPRSPLRHPEQEPLVWAIDEWHSPIYWFPRDCPRIVRFAPFGKIMIWIPGAWEDRWRTATLSAYEFDSSQGFESREDHGVWVSRQSVVPVAQHELADLPEQHALRGTKVQLVDSLIPIAESLYDFEKEVFRTTDHVSMIRWRD